MLDRIISAIRSFLDLPSPSMTVGHALHQPRRTPNRPLAAYVGIQALDALVLEGATVLVSYRPPGMNIVNQKVAVEVQGRWYASVFWPDGQWTAWSAVSFEQLVRMARRQVASKDGRFDRS